MEVVVESTKKVIHSIIKETLNINPKTIDPEVPWYELGVESVDMVEFLLAIRDRFKIDFELSELSQLETIDQLIGYVERVSATQK